MYAVSRYGCLTVILLCVVRQLVVLCIMLVLALMTLLVKPRKTTNYLFLTELCRVPYGKTRCAPVRKVARQCHAQYLLVSMVCDINSNRCRGARRLSARLVLSHANSLTYQYRYIRMLSVLGREPLHMQSETRTEQRLDVCFANGAIPCCCSDCRLPVN